MLRKSAYKAANLKSNAKTLTNPDAGFIIVYCELIGKKNLIYDLKMAFCDKKEKIVFLDL